MNEQATTHKAVLLLCLLPACGCKTVKSRAKGFCTSTEIQVESRDYDALWEATSRVLSRHGRIEAAQKEPRPEWKWSKTMKGYVATEPRKRELRRTGAYETPATFYSTERIEARLYERAGPVFEVKLRVYEQQSAPHRVKVYRQDTKEARPRGRRALGNFATASTQSPTLERMLLEEIARELKRQGQGEDEAAPK